MSERLEGFSESDEEEDDLSYFSPSKKKVRSEPPFIESVWYTIDRDLTI